MRWFSVCEALALLCPLNMRVHIPPTPQPPHADYTCSTVDLFAKHVQSVLF